MSETISEKDADNMLMAAWESEKEIPEDPFTLMIQSIIEGTHKTYRYILLTGILAKATNSKINPICLQAGADLKGAYDARSLCHIILVPFEKKYLRNVIGGSNEPFLNKPARFTHLSLDNAVRKGKDRLTLEKLINILSSLTTQSAFEYLIFSLSILRKRQEALSRLNELSLEKSYELNEVLKFIKDFLANSYEGESSVIIVGTIEKLSHLNKDYSAKVEVHKVNQSGASSKEVADIDVYIDGDIDYSIEVKDKAFNSSDIKHAFAKMVESNVKKGYFIFGLNGIAKDDYLTIIEENFQNSIFYVISDILTYCKIILSRAELDDKNIFFEKVMETAIEINSKDEVKKHIQELLEKLAKSK